MKIIKLIQVLLMFFIYVRSLHLKSKENPRLIDLQTSKILQKFFDKLISKFSWIYNATIPHGYEIDENSYNVPIYTKFQSYNKPVYTGYTKDYLLESDDKNEEIKMVKSPLMTFFEKYELFKNNADLLFMTKIILKLLVFKKIIKFIALVCLLFFLPTIKEEENTSRKLENNGKSTSK